MRYLLFGLLFLGITGVCRGESWVIDSQEEWQANTREQKGLEMEAGKAGPAGAEAELASVLKKFSTKRKAESILFEQSPEWLSWEPAGDLGPVNLGDAPVMLSLGPKNYWMFGRYGGGRQRGASAQAFEPQPAKLEGFEIPLTTTPFPNQFDAPG